MDVGEVKARLTADTSDWTSKMAEAVSSANALSTGIGVLGGMLAEKLVEGAHSAATAVAKFAFTVTDSASKTIEQLDFMAQATGLTVQQFEQLEPAMRRNNVSAEQLGMMFRFLARNIHEAGQDITGKAAKAFDELGLSMTGLESPSQVFGLIAERISKLPDGLTKTRLETELLGRTGAQLTPILNEGAAGLKRAADEALRMGNVLSKDSNNALLAVNDSFDNLNTAQENFSRHAAVLFAPMVQGANEARVAVLNLASSIADDMTIASRTLAVRIEALFGFLKAQAQLSITEIGKVPEIFERWDTWAKGQIEAIRKQTVATTDLKQTIGEVDEKAAALARTQAKAWEQSSMALIQVDMGWKIVQASIDAYNAAQHKLGQYIENHLIKDWKESMALQQFWAEQGLKGVETLVSYEKALGSAYDASFAAAQRARQVAGGLSPTAAATGQAANALAAIDAQIAGIRRLQEGEQAAFQAHMRIASEENATDLERTKIIEASMAKQGDLARQLNILEVNRRTQIITGSADIAAATQKENDIRLTAMASLAGSELRIAQDTFADQSTLRNLRLAEIDANLQRELSVTSLTEIQKTAILRRAEAERIGIARQFPTFFEQQLRDLVDSNKFSLAQISNNFTASTAQWIVTGKGFGNFWTTLQTTIVQTFLNGLIQMAARQILHYAEMKSAEEIFQAAKTLIFGTAEGSRLAATKATGALAKGAMAAELAAIGTMAEAMLFTMGSVVITVVAMMDAIAAALTSIPVVGEVLGGAVGTASTTLAIAGGAAFTAGKLAIMGAVGAGISALGLESAGGAALADGGIITKPMLGLVGEAGPEAVIPLDRLGGFGGTQTIIIQIDRRTLVEQTLRGMPSLARLQLGNAF